MRVEDAFERGAPVRMRATKLVLPIGKIIVAQVCVVACASENALERKTSVTADSAAAGGRKRVCGSCAG